MLASISRNIILSNFPIQINKKVMKDDKKAPMLDPKLENEQNIKNQDYLGEPNSKPNSPETPSKEDPEKVPESNDPAGYGEDGNVKKSPFEKGQ